MVIRTLLNGACERVLVSGSAGLSADAQRSAVPSRTGSLPASGSALAPAQSSERLSVHPGGEWRKWVESQMLPWP